jgi:signal transduction histidine kinase
MGLRHRSIRLRVGILIVVPVLCLLALYGFAASITLGNALTEAHAKSLRDQLLGPLTALQSQLDAERHVAALVLAMPRNAQLRAQYGLEQDSTEKALRQFEQTAGSSGVLGNSSATEHQAITTLVSATRNIGTLRHEVSAGAISIPQTVTDYSNLVDQGYTVMNAAMAEQSNVPLATQGLDIITLDEVEQTALEESDLLGADISRGRFPTADRTLFAQLASQRSSELSGSLPLLNHSYLGLLGQNLTRSEITGIPILENTIIATPWRHGPPPQIVASQGEFQAYSAGMGAGLETAAADLQNQSQHDADVVFTQLILAGGLGLLAAVVSILLSLYIGRGLVQQLRNLRQSALGLAHDKLPEVIQQLRDGQQIELSEYVAAEEPGSGDEIEQVQHAFDVVQQTAVQSAVDEARLRRGISDVFRNLAGRSQSLLQRQLTLLDGMERRATEPDELDDLFRIDHLTTRMRRHAEGLIILSGEAPARGWRQPVPLIDVLRAAVAEVEDYTRVRVLSRTRSAIAGHAVADVIHLVAELAENATVFSPPNTPVRIQGDVVGKGIAIEIEDRGLGISAERLAEVNANLANPPQFDLSDSDRLGLFITGQLAHRHGISVTLQPSVYGGTTAIVLIPLALCVADGSYLPDPALPAGTLTGQVAGRHAALIGADRDRLPAGNGVTVLGDADPLGLPAAAPVGLMPMSGGPSTVDLPPVDLPPVGLPPVGLPPVDLPPVDLPPADLPRHDVAAGGLPSRSRPAVAASFDRGLADSDGPIWQLSPNQPAAETDELDVRVTTTELEELGLPVRVRQANLAPQLRDSQPAPAAHEPADSPEAARSTMSALQRGWQLGRAEADGQPPDPLHVAHGTVSPGPVSAEPASPAGGDAASGDAHPAADRDEENENDADANGVD